MADNIVKTKTEILKSLEGEQLKQHIVYDADIRPILIFEAPINTADGEPCLVTEYVYRTGENEVVSRQERQYRWKSVWETDFIFDPSVDYDLDGDGIL